LNDFLPDATPLLKAEGIVKQFGSVVALNGLSMELRPGEVLGLLGDNGAGKSTLLKILTGYMQPDAGTVRLDGEVVRFRDVQHARSLGIDIIYQDLALVDQLSIVQNIFLNRESTTSGPIRVLRRRAMRREAENLIERVGVKLPSLDQPVGTLSGGQRAAVAIARVVQTNARVLLLDEPLAAVGVREARIVIDVVRNLRAEGVSVIVILHNYGHVIDLCERFYIVRGGEIAEEGRIEGHTSESLIAAVLATRL
jgi:simple sugar transport system ATP-binding protein